MKPDNTPRLSAEMLATADALRHMIGQTIRLAEAKHPAVLNQPAAAVVLVDGPNVADALDTLAGRLAIEQ